MCGIAGIAFNDVSRPADGRMLRRMTAVMRHRGPDSEGFHTGPGIGLGMCRLSIVDTTTGDQPIANEDGSVIVIGNGEIYNHVEWRERLLAKGHRFRSRSDTEVIVHLYEDDPDGFLDSLRGMFALALWDAHRRCLLLVRDRLGIKPLHYAFTRDGIVFGSELKTVLASGQIAAARDDRALRELFMVGLVRAPRTLVRGVSRLRAGECLRFAAGQVTRWSFWDVSFPGRNEYDRGTSAAQWAERLRGKLDESVRLHLRSDVPVGLWLSGGIDSTSVAALASRALSRPVPSFTLGFDDRGADELAANRLLDEYPQYCLVAHRRQARREHGVLLPRAVWHREQPLSLGVDISRLLIAELAAQQVKVVLTGEGADEILGGYSWYWTQRLLGPLADWPGPCRALAARLLCVRWPGAARTLLTPGEMNLERFAVLTGRQTAPAELLAAELAGEGDADPLELPPVFSRWHPFAQLQYLDIKLRLAESVVNTLDLHSMACSLEARVPFLDHLLVEFCAAIPPHVKMRGLQEKTVLRRAMRGVLPPALCRRRKHPLSAPTRDWFDVALASSGELLLSDASLRAAGCFQPARVAALLAQHRRGQADHSRPLMLVLTTQLWNNLFLKQPIGAAPCVAA